MPRGSTLPGRSARRCGSRGPAPWRCSSRSCRTTSRRCTCSATATASAAAVRPGGRSPAARCGRTRCTSSRRAGYDVNYFSVLAALGSRRRCWCAGSYRPLVFCVATVAAPVVFFSVVPTSGDSALFFDRYMIPVTPAFLVLVCVGIFTIASWAGTWRVLVAVVLVAGLAAIEVRFDLAHRRATHRIGVDSVVAAVRHEPAGHRALRLDGNERRELLGVRLRAPGEPPRPSRRAARSVAHPRRRRGVREPRAVPAQPRSRATGLWLFYAASPDETAAAERALGTQPIRRPLLCGAVAQHRSRRARSCARVCDCALAWKQAVPFNRRVDELLLADRSALAGTCVAYGDLGDPGISPHWPPVKTTHQ